MTSRDPGYWTYEALAYVLSTLGGYVLSNLMSFVVTLLIVWRFYRFASRLKIVYPMLWIGCLLATPVFAIASTSTMDYVWSLLCIILCAEQLLEERFVVAAALAGIAISFRAANITVIGGGFAALIGWEIFRYRRVTSVAINLSLSGIASALLGCVTYVLSYRVAGNSMSFMRPMTGPPAMWTLKMHVGRFFYKDLYLFGPIAMVVLAVAAVRYFMRKDPPVREESSPAMTRMLVLFWGFVLADVALFYKFPVEISYLIPAVFFFLLIAGSTFFRGGASLALALFLAVLSLNFILPSFAQPNIPGHSTAAHLRFAWGPGMLLEDIYSRRLYISCRDMACYNQHQP